MKRKLWFLLNTKKKSSLKNFVVQTPSLYNINAPVKNKNCWDLDIPLHGKKNNKVNEFIEFIEKLDNKFIYDARINSSIWFKNFDNEEINYQKTIRSCKTEKFKNGMIRIKIINNNDFYTCIQLNNKENITVNEIPKNSWFKMIFDIYAIWINKNGFGLFVKPILISFSPITVQKYKFLDESENDNVEEIIDLFSEEEDDTSVFIKNNSNNISSDEKETSQLDMGLLQIDNKKNFSSTSSDKSPKESSEESSE